MKTSGEGEEIYVNSLFSGGSTQTADFTAYVNPYIVVSKGGQYTKHIYIGSQRIVSKLGDLDSYGSDPRRIEYAGANVDGAKVDYKTKYQALQQTIKDRYAAFEVPYHGKDNDDYVNGSGFCCDDSKTLKSFAAGANDNPELFQYYYHSDHLGSSSLITNLDGEVVQHIEYVPFGEVFIEERNNTWNTPYLFNAKELDEETGLYYYGARYYDPKISQFLSVDRFAEKYPSLSAYSYCANNPINAIDINGDSIIVNSKSGDYLFTLDDGKKDVIKYTAHELYEKKIQWFFSEADNYMPLVDMAENIETSKSFKHFTSEQIMEFADIDRWKISYRQEGSGDWKFVKEGADKYLMVTVDGKPFWADAIGQVPFTINYYKDEYLRTGDKNTALINTIESGRKYGNGNPIFPEYDASNGYDNIMIERAANWATKKYYLYQNIFSRRWLEKGNYSPKLLFNY